MIMLCTLKKYAYSNSLPLCSKHLQNRMKCWLLTIRKNKGDLQKNLSSSSTEEFSTKWEIPEGYETGISIYHPLVKENVPFVLKRKNILQWYSCGPTVYDSPHIGHASSYVRQDIIRRILTSVFDIDTTLVMGVTDIDDKLIKKSNETGQDIEQIAHLYETEFFNDMAALNVTPPTVISRVSDNMDSIVDFVKGIEEKGFAYVAKDDSVYFNTIKYTRYGLFRTSKDIGSGEKVKEDFRDFSLWKHSKPKEPKWNSPWGPGRPGWHIECSAMASNIFGSNFDLHSGGYDLMFPHHENEIAQSQVFHENSQWVNYWIHTGQLFLKGDKEKMSKSLNNVVSVSELLESYTANQFRMFCLLFSYRRNIEFSDEVMKKAVRTNDLFSNFIHRCRLYAMGQIDCLDVPEPEIYENLSVVKQNVEDAFKDNFNTPKALANLERLTKYMNMVLKDAKQGEVCVRKVTPITSVGLYIERVLKHLGICYDSTTEKSESDSHLKLHNAVKSAVDSRNHIRTFLKDKDHMMACAAEYGIGEKEAKNLMKKLYAPLWKASDDIRADILKSANVQITDDKTGSTWTIVEKNPVALFKPKEKTAVTEKEKKKS